MRLVSGADTRAADSRATRPDAKQNGDLVLGDAHGSSTEEPALVQATPWGVKETLTFEKTAVGFYLSGHLFDEVAEEVRHFAKRSITDLIDTREPQLLAGIVTDLRFINGQRGKLALFKLDDKSGVIEARADEALINAHKNLLKDDELIVVMGKVQPDRFSGGMQLTVLQLSSLEAARCRYGKHLLVTLAAAPSQRRPDVARLLKDYPAQREATDQGDLWRGLGVRLALACVGETGAASAELQLGEHRFYPSDAALASWQAQASPGSATIVYQ
jgi:DNA polymerase-3 subunit alpha